MVRYQEDRYIGGAVPLLRSDDGHNVRQNHYRERFVRPLKLPGGLSGAQMT